MSGGKLRPGVLHCLRSNGAVARSDTKVAIKRNQCSRLFKTLWLRHAGSSSASEGELCKMICNTRNDSSSPCSSTTDLSHPGQRRKQLPLPATACDVFAAARALRLDGLADPALVAALPEDACASSGTCHCRSSDSIPLKRRDETVSDTIGTAFVSAFLSSWPSAQCGRTAIPWRIENQDKMKVRCGGALFDRRDENCGLYRERR